MWSQLRPRAHPSPSRSGAVDTGPPQVTSEADDWYRRDLKITTRVDSDGDGRRDRVHATLVRPTESDRDGVKLATVVWASPYFACCGEAPNHDVDVPLYVPKDPRPADDDPVRQFARRWVPHGYAVLVVESLGSGDSTGCPTIGDAKETAGPKAAIDWLNGRARARDLRPATWSRRTGRAAAPAWPGSRTTGRSPTWLPRPASRAWTPSSRSPRSPTGTPTTATTDSSSRPAATRARTPTCSRSSTTPGRTSGSAIG